MDTKTPAAHGDSGGESPQTIAGHRCIDSNTLFNQQNIVFLKHNGETYVLRNTRQGKLILTK